MLTGIRPMTSRPHEVVPFGKYKGQPAEAMIADRQYCDWLVSQDWFRDRFQSIYQVVINYGQEPQETPEHNEIQARFVDRTFCSALASMFFGTVIRKDDIIDEARSAIAERSSREASCGRIHDGDCYHYAKGSEIRSEKITERERSIEISQLSFEDAGWDVSFSAHCRNYLSVSAKCDIAYGEGKTETKDLIASYGAHQASFYVEIKPHLSDDFPAVLRQIKARRSLWDKPERVLLVRSASFEKVTFDQVSAMFAQDRISIVRENQVDEILNQRKAQK